MNRNAANAILKVLEEPPRRAVLLLACNNPGRLLPTIRSRCRRLDLEPLDEDAIAGWLGAHAPDLAEAEPLRAGPPFRGLDRPGRGAGPGGRSRPLPPHGRADRAAAEARHGRGAQAGRPDRGAGRSGGCRLEDDQPTSCNGGSAGWSGAGAPPRRAPPEVVPGEAAMIERLVGGGRLESLDRGVGEDRPRPRPGRRRRAGPEIGADRHLCLDRGPLPAADPRLRGPMPTVDPAPGTDRSDLAAGSSGPSSARQIDATSMLIDRPLPDLDFPDFAETNNGRTSSCAPARRGRADGHHLAPASTGWTRVLAIAEAYDDVFRRRRQPIRTRPGRPKERLVNRRRRLVDTDRRIRKDRRHRARPGPRPTSNDHRPARGAAGELPPAHGGGPAGPGCR